MLNLTERWSYISNSGGHFLFVSSSNQDERTRKVRQKKKKTDDHAARGLEASKVSQTASRLVPANDFEVFDAPLRSSMRPDTCLRLSSILRGDRLPFSQRSLRQNNRLSSSAVLIRTIVYLVRSCASPYNSLAGSIMLISRL